MNKKSPIFRRLDNLGRLTLPVELREQLHILPGDELSIFLEGETIFLQKYNPGCELCGKTENIVEHKGRCFCRSCLMELSSLVRYNNM